MAARDLRAGAPITPDDVELRRLAAASVPSDALFGLAALADTKTTTRIMAGQPLRRGQLGAIPLVRRGARVTISVTLRGLRVTGRGVARQDGRAGETITVLAASSSKLLKARVVGRHHVVVDM